MRWLGSASGRLVSEAASDSRMPGPTPTTHARGDERGIRRQRHLLPVTCRCGAGCGQSADRGSPPLRFSLCYNFARQMLTASKCLCFICLSVLLRHRPQSNSLSMVSVVCASPGGTMLSRQSNFTRRAGFEPRSTLAGLSSSMFCTSLPPYSSHLSALKSPTIAYQLLTTIINLFYWRMLHSIR